MSKIKKSQLTELQSLFDDHLLKAFKDAASTSVTIMNLDRFLTEYTFGGSFWDGYSQRIIELGKKGGPLENCVTFGNNDLQIKSGELSLRCHRIEPESGVPKGGLSTKKSALAKSPYNPILLPSDQVRSLFLERGNLIIGLTIDTTMGLSSVDLKWIHPTYDKTKSKLSSLQVKNLYTNTELPDVVEEPKLTSSSDRVLEKIEIDVEIQNE
ncbi:hypothetical protein [Maridesulfovibrio bastinii]|uniref:hypothetical protein n=1 Tax=Maridesulfovibrio bastinii TaxID=47157 RepID=UPI0004251F0A|nr:hypothetical protein [Maridesulfovibrio bastinii]